MLALMVMEIGAAAVLAGVIYGYYTVKGSGINERPYDGRGAPGLGGSTFSDPKHNEDPFESWTRGTR